MSLEDALGPGEDLAGKLEEDETDFSSLDSGEKSAVRQHYLEAAKSRAGDIPELDGQRQIAEDLLKGMEYVNTHRAGTEEPGNEEARLYLEVFREYQKIRNRQRRNRRASPKGCFSSKRPEEATMEEAIVEITEYETPRHGGFQLGEFVVETQKAMDREREKWLEEGLPVPPRTGHVRLETGL